MTLPSAGPFQVCSVRPVYRRRRKEFQDEYRTLTESDAISRDSHSHWQLQDVENNQNQT